MNVGLILVIVLFTYFILNDIMNFVVKMYAIRNDKKVKIKENKEISSKSINNNELKIKK